MSVKVAILVNGRERVVEFDRTPSEADIDDAARSLKAQDAAAGALRLRSVAMPATTRVTKPVSPQFQQRPNLSMSDALKLQVMGQSRTAPAGPAPGPAEKKIVNSLLQEQERKRVAERNSKMLFGGPNPTAARVTQDTQESFEAAKKFVAPVADPIGQALDWLNTYTLVGQVGKGLTSLRGQKPMSGKELTRSLFGGIVNAPIDITGSLAIATSTNTTPLEKAGAGAEIVRDVALPGVAKGAGKIVKAGKDLVGFRGALGGLVDDAIEAGAKSLDDVPTKTTPKAKAPSVPVTRATTQVEEPVAPKVEQPKAVEPKPQVQIDTPSEAKPKAGKKPVSGTTASAAEDRADIRLPEFEQAPKEKITQWVKEAETSGKVRDARTIAQSVVDNPRPLSDVETTALTLRRKELRQSYDDTLDEISQGIAKGEDVSAAKTKLADLEEEWDTVTKAVQTSGTEWGRSGVARQIEISEDYSKIGLIKRAEAKAGRKLTDAERKAFEDQAAALTAKEDQIKALEAELKKVQAEQVTLKESKKAPRFNKKDLDKELDDIFREFKETTKALKGQANDAFTVALTYGYEGTRAIGRVAVNVMKRGVNTLDEVVAQVQKLFKEKGIDVSRDDVLQGIDLFTTGRPRTKNEIQAQIAKLKREAKAQAKAIRENQSVPTPEGKRMQGYIDRNASEPTKEARRIQNLEKQIANMRKAIESGKVSPKAKQAASEKVAALEEELKALKQQAKYISEGKAVETKEARLLRQTQKRIAEYERQLREGDFVVPTKKEAQYSQRLQEERMRADSLRRQVKARIKAMQPTTPAAKVAAVGREIQLANPVARIMDVAANTAKMGAYIIQNPGRSLLSKIAFGRTAGRETLITPARMYRVLKGMKGRVKAEVGDILKGADLETIEKYGRGGGLFSKLAGAGDVPFKDVYRRLALDDYAATLAAKQPSKAEKRLFHEQAWKQLTEGGDGPLTRAQVDEAHNIATDWALRQTFNVDNLVSMSVDGIKNFPQRAIRKQYGDVAADSWSAMIDALTRFSKVIGNVVLERANYNPALGGGEAVARLMLSKSSNGLLKSIPATEARLIADLATKGLVGAATFQLGRSSYDWITQQEWIKGEIVTTESGRRFVQWELFPDIAGGADATQLGGLLNPILMGATAEMIERSGLTEKQKADLWKKYQVDQAVSQPFTSAARDIGDLAAGEKDPSKFAGSLISRNVIPGGVRDLAERMDKQRTGARLRKTDDFWDEFKKRIPVVRESLPRNDRP
jgi:hypothetical protein